MLRSSVSALIMTLTVQLTVGLINQFFNKHCEQYLTAVRLQAGVWNTSPSRLYHNKPTWSQSAVLTTVRRRASYCLFSHPGSGVVTSQLLTTARSYLKLRWCLLPLPLLLWRNRAYKASTRKELRLLEEPRPGLLTAFVIPPPPHCLLLLLPLPFVLRRSDRSTADMLIKELWVPQLSGSVSACPRARAVSVSTLVA